MPRLHGNDARRGGEQRGIAQQMSSAEVSAYANVLDKTRNGDHRGDVGEHTREVEGAVQRRLRQRDQCGLQYGRMGRLVALDYRKLLQDYLC